MSISLAGQPARDMAGEMDPATPMVSPTGASIPIETFISPETFRQLFVSLDLPPEGGSVLGITSSIAGEGCSTVAVGLAQTLATDLDTGVVLVDLNLHQPALAARLGIPPSEGIADVLRGDVVIDDVLRQVSDGLFLVSGHEGEADSARLLRGLSEQDPFESLRTLGMLTILDLPPILDQSYSSLAASLADALVLVVRAGVTPAATVGEAIARLRGPLQGVVFNGETRRRPSWWPGRSR